MSGEDYAQLLGQDPTGQRARALITAARQTGPLPRYGTADWQALPDGDPRRWAAVLVAAECWRLESCPQWQAAQLAAELDGAHWAAVAEWEDMWRRTLDSLTRVDRARAAGGDIGLPVGERLHLARQPRPGARRPSSPSRPQRAREEAL